MARIELMLFTPATNGTTYYYPVWVPNAATGGGSVKWLVGTTGVETAGAVNLSTFTRALRGDRQVADRHFSPQEGPRAMQLPRYTQVPSGLSFALDTGPEPRLAYVLSTPGAAAVISLGGTGTWTVEVLTSTDGQDFTVRTTLTSPGQWRYPTTGVAAIGLRVATYTTGSILGTVAYGGAAPITNVSPMFGAFLIYSFNATAVEPPIGNQIRFNQTKFADVTKVWIRNWANDGTDQYLALRKIPHGGTLLVQDRLKHEDAVLFRLLAPPIDKTDYVELTVAYQETTGALVAGQVVLAVFNPGPVVSLNPLTPTQLPAVPPDLPDKPTLPEKPTKGPRG